MPNNPEKTANTVSISDMPLTARHCYLVLVASMEQLIGAALSSIVGIIIPLLNLILHPELSSEVQGLMGATGLIGIAIGSAVIGPMTDRQGYARWFRVCPILIIVGSTVASIVPSPAIICVGLFVAGFGVGGGYPLDSAYISELMPDKWRGFMVGVAKASSALGFILSAAIAVVLLNCDPSAQMWRAVVWIMGLLALVTLLMRLRWPDSPVWLVNKGFMAEAKKSAIFFYRRPVEISDVTGSQKEYNPPVGKLQLFKGKNLIRVIYSGIPWACEGLGVYGIGVFLPVIIMALGIDNAHVTGLHHVINSIELTAVINFCILPGFIIGLLIVNRVSHSLMLWGGFVGSAVGMGLLLAAYLLSWPVWVSIVAFMLFEIFLNAGPHLVTYIIPAAIFPVNIRGTGSGIADFLGKLGAIIGVFFMPLLLRAGGVCLVLTVTISVMMAGALISYIFSRLI